ncbi:hypothetical protein H6G00_31340 [Leptolyngbya sp. FACHB-541]|uniref:hypothetical protein n=1 Tax=Leptolyngbya sp. FACHB-541 TaxID=2692810 RepID=UPI0016826194|nr:hypothetical protein [Leptolyngbya sp. FACHB-541]MBD2001040.1 hypothetical protein [Leptolyngbya sp. FACHB-541]
MKKQLLTLATVITATATGISLSLATLPNPTDIQKQLSNTANMIAIGGTTAIFGLLDDEDEDNSTDR